MDISSLHALLSRIELASETLKHHQTVFTQVEASVKDAEHTRRLLRQEYRDGRQALVLESLERYGKALCANCYRLRPRDQMSTVTHKGRILKSDCSYSEWYESYRTDRQICHRCTSQINFSVSIIDGYEIGYELSDFDPRVHDAWLKYSADNLDTAIRALGLDLPNLSY